MCVNLTWVSAERFLLRSVHTCNRSNWWMIPCCARLSWHCLCRGKGEWGSLHTGSPHYLFMWQCFTVGTYNSRTWMRVVDCFEPSLCGPSSPPPSHRCFPELHTLCEPPSLPSSTPYSITVVSSSVCSHLGVAYSDSTVTIFVFSLNCCWRWLAIFKSISAAFCWL